MSSRLPTSKLENETILIQNFHPPATRALIRDFQKIGMKVYSPASNWDRISYYDNNEGLGGELISYEEFMNLKPSYVLVACKPQEYDLKKIARAHGDRIILHVAQHLLAYEAGLSDIMLCPDIQTFENYPSLVARKILYFSRPHLSFASEKNTEKCFAEKRISSFISLPNQWRLGNPSTQEFVRKYPHEVKLFGHEARDGLLTHHQCNERMLANFFTIHFKEQEAYGLSCLESMLLGTPIVSLKKYMNDKTLGRFFLDSENSILTDTVDEAIQAIASLDYDAYVRMCKNARSRVIALTEDEKTVNFLEDAIVSQNELLGWPCDGAKNFTIFSILTENKASSDDSNSGPVRLEHDQFAETFAFLVRKLGVETICEVGSHTARDTLFFAKSCSECTVLAFEANPESFFQYSLSNAALSAKLSIQNIAISDSEGCADFFIPLPPEDANENVRLSMKGMGSLLKRPDILESKNYVVSTRRLDSIMSCAPSNMSLALWLDVEGNIKAALKGAEETLKNTKILKMKLENYRFWEGQALASEILISLASAGFRLVACSDRTMAQFEAILVSEKYDIAEVSRAIGENLSAA